MAAEVFPKFVRRAFVNAGESDAELQGFKVTRAITETDFLSSEAPPSSHTANSPTLLNVTIYISPFYVSRCSTCSESSTQGGFINRAVKTLPVLGGRDVCVWNDYI